MFAAMAGVLDGDDAVLGHFLHGLGDDVTDISSWWVICGFFMPSLGKWQSG